MNRAENTKISPNLLSQVQKTGQMQVLPKGTHWIPGYLNRAKQEALVEEIRIVATAAPFYHPQMPRTGKPLSVRMTNCGSLGWICDKQDGYRYQKHHPVTQSPWPSIPNSLLEIWQELASYPLEPEACLINYYSDIAKMGLHQDKDEKNFEAPIVSISLGDTCLFRIGGRYRKDKTMSFKLASGDAVILSGESRLAFHGVDRIYRDTSTLLKNGGRLNLTMRRVG